jgi:hypothetical protein
MVLPGGWPPARSRPKTWLIQVIIGGNEIFMKKKYFLSEAFDKFRLSSRVIGTVAKSQMFTIS